MYLYIPKDLDKNRTKKRPIEPEMIFASLCYRGVHYSKWVCTNSLALNYQHLHGEPMEDWALDW